jgi:hypothetical protein
MLIDQKIIVKWCPANREWYESKSYEYEYRGEMEINAFDLPLNSHKKVKVICDYCSKQYETVYKDLLKRRKVVDKDSCQSCSPKKIKDVNMTKYGVDHPMKLQSNKDKIKEVWLDKYGVENPMHLESSKEKIRQTNLVKYGVEYHTQTDEWKDKIKTVCLETYGHKSVMHVDDIKSKLRQTLYQNGTAPVSIQQEYIHKLIGGELNYPHETSSLDIAFPDEKIYVEYHGGGHWLSVKLGTETMEEFNKRNKNRWYALYRKGWKDIRVISKNDFLPSNNKIKEIINCGKDILNSGRSWVQFDIDKDIVETSKIKEEYDFGELRRIYKQYIELV